MAKFSETGKETGASDLGAIVEVDGEHLFPFGNSPNDVLQRHRAALEGIDLFPISRIMEAGNRFEGVIRGWFEDDYHCEVDVPTGGFASKHCNMTASLDGMIKGPLEIVDYLGTSWSLTDDEIVWECKFPTYPSETPDALDRVLQVQGQMDCSGAGVAVIAELARSNMTWQIAVVHAHQGMTAAIHQAVHVFWDHMAKDTDYPPATTTEANKLVAGNRRPDVLDLIDGIPDGSIIDANGRDMLMNLAEGYWSADKALKVAKEVKERTQLEIQNIMGGVERLVLPGGKINWTTSESKPTELTTKVIPAKPAKVTRRFTAKEATNE